MLLTSISFAYENLQSEIIIQKEETNQSPEEKIIIETDVDEVLENKLLEEANLENKMWQVEIPSISLVAPIAQGTSQEVMLNYVGHFEETNFWKGNIGLAAHNRRIPNKLF